MGGCQNHFRRRVRVTATGNGNPQMIINIITNSNDYVAGVPLDTALHARPADPDAPVVAVQVRFRLPANNAPLATPDPFSINDQHTAHDYEYV